MLETTTNLKTMLSDPTLLETRAYVGGEWIGGDKGTFDVTNPARGDVVAQVADLSREQVGVAIAKAERNFRRHISKRREHCNHAQNTKGLHT